MTAASTKHGAIDEFRYVQKNLYGIKTLKPVCYPPQTLLEGMPYERGMSGLERHLQNKQIAELERDLMQLDRIVDTATKQINGYKQ